MLHRPIFTDKPQRLARGPVQISEITGALLSRLADIELQHGHHAAAERLEALAEAAGEASQC